MLNGHSATDGASQPLSRVSYPSSGSFKWIKAVAICPSDRRAIRREPGDWIGITFDHDE
jgi:hypothetical protein